MVTEPDGTGQQGLSSTVGEGRTVAEIARAVVARAAPDEAPFFDELSGQFFASPARMLHPPRPRDEPTSSTIQGAAELITSIVVAGVSGVLSDEIKQMITAAARRSRGFLRWRAARKLRACQDAVRNGRLAAAGTPEARRQGEAAQDATVRLAVEVGMDQAAAQQLGMTVFVMVSSGSSGDGEGGQHGRSAGNA